MMFQTSAGLTWPARTHVSAWDAGGPQFQIFVSVILNHLEF